MSSVLRGSRIYERVVYSAGSPGAGMAYSSLIGFYYLCRAVLIKSEAYYDKFDLAFARFFEGVETPEDLPEQIWNGWKGNCRTTIP